MKILIAEDDADDRTLASLAFKEIHTEHEIEFAVDGQDLMDNLMNVLIEKKKLPDMILLDLNMPRKDGRTALKEIKKNTALKQIEVIILSTSTSDHDKKFTKDLGAQKYFVKPPDFDKLVDILRSISQELVE